MNIYKYIDELMKGDLALDPTTNLKWATPERKHKLKTIIEIVEIEEKKIQDKESLNTLTKIKKICKELLDFYKTHKPEYMQELKQELPQLSIEEINKKEQELIQLLKQYEKQNSKEEQISLEEYDRRKKIYYETCDEKNQYHDFFKQEEKLFVLNWDITERILNISQGINSIIEIIKTFRPLGLDRELLIYFEEIMQLAAKNNKKINAKNYVEKLGKYCKELVNKNTLPYFIEIIKKLEHDEGYGLEYIGKYCADIFNKNTAKYFVKIAKTRKTGLIFEKIGKSIAIILGKNDKDTGKPQEGIKPYCDNPEKYIPELLNNIDKDFEDKKELNIMANNIGISSTELNEIFKQSTEDGISASIYIMPRVFTIYRELIKINPNIPKKLFQEQGIILYNRYSLEILKNQCQNLENKNSKYGLLIISTEDHNGAHEADIEHITELIKDLKKENYILKIIEVDNVAKIYVQILKATNSMKHKASFLFIIGHGEKDTIQFGNNLINGTQKSKKFGNKDKLHKNFFPDNNNELFRTIVKYIEEKNINKILNKIWIEISEEYKKDYQKRTGQEFSKRRAIKAIKIVKRFQRLNDLLEPRSQITLFSCSTGIKEGIAQKMSEVFSTLVIAPDKDTMVKKIYVEKNKYEQLRFHIIYTKAKAIAYFNGELADTNEYGNFDLYNT